jgi:hypothetical protein
MSAASQSGGESWFEAADIALNDFIPAGFNSRIAALIRDLKVAYNRSCEK